MATFYVLPPRPSMALVLAHFLREYLPGTRPDMTGILELLRELPDRDEHYVVYRDELPDGDDITELVRDACGGEEGDEVIRISTGARMDAPRVRVSRIEADRSHDSVSALL